jgi:hypothetical protein
MLKAEKDKINYEDLSFSHRYQLQRLSDNVLKDKTSALI